MKIGTHIHVGSMQVKHPEDGVKFMKLCFVKVDIRNYNSSNVWLPAAAVVINGFNFPVIQLVDLPNNSMNWQPGSKSTLSNFVNNENWAVANSRKNIPSIGFLRRTIKSVNAMRKTLGLYPLKHKLSLWMLCNTDTGLVLHDSFFQILDSTASNKPVKLSTYSVALPLP
jgi:hypothetical protein